MSVKDASENMLATLIDARNIVEVVKDFAVDWSKMKHVSPAGEMCIAHIPVIQQTYIFHLPH